MWIDEFSYSYTSGFRQGKSITLIWSNYFVIFYLPFYCVKVLEGVYLFTVFLFKKQVLIWQNPFKLFGAML